MGVLRNPARKREMEVLQPMALILEPYTSPSIETSGSLFFSLAYHNDVCI